MVTGKILKFIGIGFVIASIIFCTSAIISSLGSDSSFIGLEFILFLFFLGIFSGIVTYAFGLIVQNSCIMTSILESLSDYYSDNN